MILLTNMLNFGGLAIAGLRLNRYMTKLVVAVVVVILVVALVVVNRNDNDCE